MCSDVAGTSVGPAVCGEDMSSSTVTCDAEESNDAEESKLFGVSLTDVLHYSDPLSAARVAGAIKAPDFRVRRDRPSLNKF